jgi:hypothetical protein
LPGLFVVPSVHLQTAFDENWPPLFQIFASDFCEARPAHHIHISNFLAFFSAVSGINAVDGNTEIATALPLGV